MRTQAGVVGVLVLILAVGAYYAFAAESAAPSGGETGTAAATPPAAKGAPAPSERMAPSEMTEEQMLERMNARMKESGMSDETIMKHNMMATAKFQNNEPMGLLAMKKDLKLTDEQVKKLEQIDENARKEAKAVLDKDQEAMVDKMSGPDSMMGMQKEMMSKGGGMMRGRMRPGMSGSMSEGSPAEEAAETPAQETKEKAAGKD